jgi:hypothetical protein
MPAQKKVMVKDTDQTQDHHLFTANAICYRPGDHGSNNTSNGIDGHQASCLRQWHIHSLANINH